MLPSKAIEIEIVNLEKPKFSKENFFHNFKIEKGNNLWN